MRWPHARLHPPHHGPPRLRPPIRAIYAFARTADDIADEGPATASERLDQLSAYRAALARCLARQPEVLLLDEPFGALDEVTRADMQQLLLQLIAAHNTAAVLITHDIDEALLLSDRVLLLGNHPAHILGQWHIDLPQPRTQRVEELGALRIDILKTLRRASRTVEPTPTPLPSEAVHVHG